MGQDKINRFLGWMYRITICVIVFTGFGNLPLWKRYYIADIPGFGWTGDFIVNLQVHYVAGSLLLFLAAYFLVARVFPGKSGFRLTKTGVVRVAMLWLVLITGVFMAFKNLSGAHFSFTGSALLTLVHLISASLFTVFSLGCLVARKRWSVR